MELFLYKEESLTWLPETSPFNKKATFLILS